MGMNQNSYTIYYSTSQSVNAAYQSMDTNHLLNAAKRSVDGANESVDSANE